MLGCVASDWQEGFRKMKSRRRLWRGLMWAALAVMLAGCFRNRISELELDVPAMRTEQCARLVEDALNKLAAISEDAIKSKRVDVEQRKVWVEYDNVRLRRRNIETAVRHAGFAVNDLPADEQARARLPEACRGQD